MALAAKARHEDFTSCYCNKTPVVSGFDGLTDVRALMGLQPLFHASQVVYILLHVLGTGGLDTQISSTEHYIGSTIHNLQDTHKQQDLENSDKTHVQASIPLCWPI